MSERLQYIAMWPSPDEVMPFMSTGFHNLSMTCRAMSPAARPKIVCFTVVRPCSAGGGDVQKTGRGGGSHEDGGTGWGRTQSSKNHFYGLKKCPWTNGTHYIAICLFGCNAGLFSKAAEKKVSTVRDEACRWNLGSDFSRHSKTGYELLITSSSKFPESLVTPRDTVLSTYLFSAVSSEKSHNYVSSNEASPHSGYTTLHAWNMFWRDKITCFTFDILLLIARI